jgi:hypothetical protein
MNIRSVDLQVLIPRSTEVGKTQQINQHQNTLQQQHMAEEWQSISTQRQRQVLLASKTEGGVVKEGYDRENGHSKQRHSQEQSHSTTSSPASVEQDHDNPLLGNIIDIKT